MTEATRAVLQKWINENSIGPNRIVSFNWSGSLADVCINGQADLAELAEAIEAAERERCAKIAREQKDKWSQAYIASATIDTTNEASARVNTAMDIEEKIRGGK